MAPLPDTNAIERLHGVTFYRLLELEPRLEALLWEARQAGAACRHQADVQRAFAPIRNRLTDLIGFAGQHRRHRLLGSAGAYEVAYWKLFHAITDLVPSPAKPAAIPPCKECALPEESGVTVPPNADAVPCRRPPARTRLAVRITDVAQGVIVHLEGKADLASLDQLQLALLQLLARRVPLAVLDLSELTFLATLLMGELVSFRRALARWGGCVRIAGARPEVYEALQMACMTELFEFYPTGEEATAATVPLPTA
jgi:anti-anti-sigma factor